MKGAEHYRSVDRNGMNELLKQHLPLVKRIGLHLKARLPGDIELDDLMQVGLMGLMNAAENFDSTQGAAFETYASIRIRGAMLDEVRRSGWTPRSVQQKTKQVAVAIQRVEARLGRAATDAEIAAELGMSLQDYHDIVREAAYSHVLSLDSEEEDQGVDVASDDENPLEGLHQEGFRKALKMALDSLPEKEKLMMSLYYNDGLNLKEIGAVMGISESRVCQIHGQAIARARSRLKEWAE